ncbi:hypothetical protein COCVIDRAFT_104348 [Bipolaris victoriae FI3]|uniref:Zn(2)-C6 fungal-type domain-containing protein n=1 Tax=Bipolaris victoriae (strain FI3) TaxID=930091 RepID=W7ELE4_BIPV3|nr:hypothetical protein COCVIDRAFT_104348 [Bipolaris victoriae FI3]
MDLSDRWQNIAPASDEPGQRRAPPDRRKRRQAVAVACVHCRNGKAKCDGTRPRCNRCKDNDLICQYDVAEGVSRAERMKIMKRDSMTGELEDLKRIINFLRSGTDDQATAILARLRLGDTPEDVAKSLSLVPSPAASTQPPSLLGQESTDTSGSAMSHDSVFDPSKPTPKFGQGSSTSLASPPGQTTAWSPSANLPHSAFAPPGRGKQSSISEEQFFLCPLFDRDDFLLPKAEDEGESDDAGDDEIEERNIDPRLTQQASTFDLRPIPSSSSKRSSQSQRLSPHRHNRVRSIYSTHLVGRQPIVNTIRIHPNLDIRSFFDNTPFPTSAESSQYSKSQDTHTRNLFLPTWAMLPINTVPDPGSLKRTVPSVLHEATNLIDNGHPVEEVIEKHPNIAALFDEEVYKKSGILSKWAVGMVHGMFLKGNTFTCFGFMYLFWSLMRWMISPSPETYNAMPEWLRPTPNQLFMPHINIVDFVVWPAFRELAVQMPAMQERMEWLMDMSLNIQCDWSFATPEALHKNEETGRVDLCDTARDVIRNLTNWSVGPSFRGYISNADSYVRIRTEGY